MRPLRKLKDGSPMTRRRFGTMALLVLLLTAAFAGCLGADDGSLETAGSDGAPGEAGAENSTTTDDSGNATDPDAKLRQRTYGLAGWGSGVGSEPTGSFFWVLGSDYRTNVRVPADHAGGTLNLTWEGPASFGGIMVVAVDEAGNYVAGWEASEPPMRVEIEPEHEGLAAAEEVIVVPNQGTPATFHGRVTWDGELRVQVPDAPAALSGGGSREAWTFERSGEGRVEESTTLNASSGRGDAGLAVDGDGDLTLTVRDAADEVVLELSCASEGDCTREGSGTGEPGAWHVTLEGAYQGSVRAGVRTG